MTVSTIGLRTPPMFQKQYQRNDCGQEPFYRKCFISSGLRNAQTSIKAHCERDKIYSKAIPNDDENLQLITSLEASTFAIHFQLQFLKINLANNFPKYLKNHKMFTRNNYMNWKLRKFPFRWLVLYFCRRFDKIRKKSFFLFPFFWQRLYLKYNNFLPEKGWGVLDTGL